MSNILNPMTRILLVQSLPSIEIGEDELRRRMSASLTRSRHDPELSDTPDLVAALLVTFLVEQVRHVLEAGEPKDFQPFRAEHRRHGIDGRHYSRFGDALVPVLSDILGPTYPRAAVEAWSDAYWALVRRLQQDGPGSASAKPDADTARAPA